MTILASARLQKVSRRSEARPSRPEAENGGRTSIIMYAVETHVFRTYSASVAEIGKFGCILRQRRYINMPYWGLRLSSQGHT